MCLFNWDDQNILMHSGIFNMGHLTDMQGRGWMVFSCPWLHKEHYSFSATVTSSESVSLKASKFQERTK